MLWKEQVVTSKQFIISLLLLAFIATFSYIYRTDFKKIFVKSSSLKLDIEKKVVGLWRKSLKSEMEYMFRPLRFAWAFFMP